MTSVKMLRAVRTDSGFHITWLMASELTGLKSCWLFFLEYHARESIPGTHSEYRRVETSASSGVGRAGPQTYRCSYLTLATPSHACVTCEKAQGGYFEQHWHSIYMWLFGLSVEQ